MSIPTPHINCEDKSLIAETILLPGDPLRAKYIADNFLTDVVKFNSVRNILGFTGTYNGKRVSVMGTGMGMPSIGIYSYELIKFYGVKNLIRVGSAGSFQENVKVRDIVIGMSASTDSNFVSQYNLPGTFAPTASYELFNKACEVAKSNGFKYHAGNILSSDVFYGDDMDSWKQWQKMGVLAVEMEAAALYMNATRLGANALCIIKVYYSLFTHEATTSQEREQTFTDMMKVALELA